MDALGLMVALTYAKHEPWAPKRGPGSYSGLTLSAYHAVLPDYAAFLA
jgi:hypothetical protein